MQKFTFQADLIEAKKFISMLVYHTLPEQSLVWLNKTIDEVSEASGERSFHMAFSAISRYTGKDKLVLEQKDVARAESIRKGWNIKNWSIDQAGRALLILSLPYKDPDKLKKILDNATNSADVAESIALYSCLPLLPHPESHCQRASDGIRNNIISVFDAVALDNPFPADYFSENAWNHLVLKGVFNNRPLSRIINIDQRANAALAGMIFSLAHERWAAGRTVTPELWRSVSPFIDEKNFPAIEKLFNRTDPLEQQAAALVCQDSSFSKAKTLLAKRNDLKKTIEENKLSWQSLGSQLT